MRYARRGRVRIVERLLVSRTWTTHSGQRLTAQPGDLLLTDGNSTWSVTSDEFARTYRPCGSVYAERFGEVDARPAVPGEVVESAEGPETAVPGDWVVSNDRGYMWLIAGSRFHETYLPVTQDS